MLEAARQLAQTMPSRARVSVALLDIEYDTAERVETDTLVAITRLVVATVRELDAAGSGATGNNQGEGEG